MHLLIWRLVNHSSPQKTNAARPSSNPSNFLIDGNWEDERFLRVGSTTAWCTVDEMNFYGLFAVVRDYLASYTTESFCLSEWVVF